MAKPPVVDQQTWRKELDELRRREKAATRELDAIAAQRRRLPMVEMPDYTLIGEDGPVRLVDVFKGRSQLIVYNHMWEDGAEWQCGGCTGFTSQFTRLDFLDNYDARFVIVTNGPIEEALAYREKVGNKMEWYSSSKSSFGADVDAPPGAGFGSTCSCATATPSTAPGTPMAVAPNSSATRSRSSTSCRGGVRRSGRIRRTAGRSRRPTRGGWTRRTSRGSTEAHRLRSASSCVDALALSAWVPTRGTVGKSPCRRKAKVIRLGAILACAAVFAHRLRDSVCHASRGSGGVFDFFPTCGRTRGGPRLRRSALHRFRDRVGLRRAGVRTVVVQLKL